MNAGDARLRESTIISIQEAVAHMFGLAVEELRKESSPSAVAVPRQIAMFLSKHMTDASVSEIGQHFGGKHYSTVRYSIARVHELRRSDAALDHLLTKRLASLTQR